MAQHINLLQIGCGQMGGAMLAGMVASLGSQGLTARVVDPQPRQLPQDSGLSFYHQLADLPTDYAPDVVVLAVKPQQVMELIPRLTPYLTANPVVISIAAGITLTQMAQGLKKGLAKDGDGDAAGGIYLVRAMPNLPAVIGQGMTAWCAARPLPLPVQARVDAVLGSMGHSLMLQDEGAMDAVTAISGSGPAYLFYLAECLMAAAQRLGLSAEVAETLVLHTLAGSGQLLKQGQGVSTAATLRQQVTSPAGTTAAALGVLMQSPHGLADLITAATTAAHHRSIELRGG